MDIDHTSFRQAVEYVAALHPGMTCSHVSTFSDTVHYGRVVHIIRTNEAQAMYDNRPSYFAVCVFNGLWTLVS